MSVIIIPKRNPPTLFPNKKAAISYLRHSGKDVSNYDVMYLYPEMVRRCFPPSYKRTHQKAALAYYHRNLYKINEQRRVDATKNKE